MKFLKKLFSSKNKNFDSEKQKSKPKIIYSDEQFILLAEMLIDTGNPKTLDNYILKLKKHKSNPETVFFEDDYYYDTENREFEVGRGTSKELKDYIQWFLLIDTLHIDNLLWELDWKEGEEEANEVVKILANVKEYKIPSLSEIDSTNWTTLDDYFSKVNIVLAKAGFSVVNLDINSDSYVTGIVKSENLNQIISQAEECGQRITKY